MIIKQRYGHEVKWSQYIFTLIFRTLTGEYNYRTKSLENHQESCLQDLAWLSSAVSYLVLACTMPQFKSQLSWAIQHLPLHCHDQTWWRYRRTTACGNCVISIIQLSPSLVVLFWAVPQMESFKPLQQLHRFIITVLVVLLLKGEQ